MTTTAQKEVLAATLATLADGVDTLRTSDAWRAMLTWQSKFHRYSANNVLLIMLQCPTATRVAGYRRWIELGRQVRKDEKSIRILAPVIRKVHADPDDDTSPWVRRCVGFSVARVFDIAQTDGDPQPEVAPVPMTGDAPEGMFGRLADWLAETGGWDVDRDDTGQAGGYTDPATHRIVIRNTDGGLEQLSTLVHEAAHALLHESTAEYVQHRGRAEVEAESVAFVVMTALGVDTSASSLPYVAGWCETAEHDVLQATAATVLRTAHTLIEALTGSTDTEEKAA